MIEIKTHKAPEYGRRGRGGKQLYPFPTLPVGGFFIVRGIDARRAASIGACGWYHAKQEGKRFFRRKVDGGYRFVRAA